MGCGESLYATHVNEKMNFATTSSSDLLVTCYYARPLQQSCEI
jgi:hypothetical protein